ncbi:MAG: ferredoxin-type protein NapF [Reinekea sp.]
MHSTRRGLFRGLAQTAQGKALQLDVLRPPGARTAFADYCTRCGDCAKACPEQIIVTGSGGFPELDFSEQGCTGCGKCIDVCKSQALFDEVPLWPLGEWRCSDDCLPNQGVACQSCKDVCDEQAIHFPLTRAIPLPQIDAARCIGCGQCVGVCPVDALLIKPEEKSAYEERPENYTVAR